MVENKQFEVFQEGGFKMHILQYSIIPFNFIMGTSNQMDLFQLFLLLLTNAPLTCKAHMYSLLISSHQQAMNQDNNDKTASSTFLFTQKGT